MLLNEDTKCISEGTTSMPVLACSLPLGFRPLPYSVIIGRGKICTDAMGNRRLRVLACTVLPEYIECSNKVDKTAAVTRLVDMIRGACPTGAFVRHTEGRWWEVDGHAAREKVGYVLRDLLHDKYRSSSKAKVARRRVERLGRRQSGSSPAERSSINEVEAHNDAPEERHSECRDSKDGATTTSASRVEQHTYQEGLVSSPVGGAFHAVAARNATTTGVFLISETEACSIPTASTVVDLTPDSWNNVIGGNRHTEI
jgi:hypothetical protein